MNKEERNALMGFLFIYISSAMVLVGIIAFLYYKKEVAAIEDKCTIEMVNAALKIEKNLMNAEKDNLPYVFKSPNEELQVGLFDQNRQEIQSNLSTKTIFFAQSAYSNNTHEYHIDTLEEPILDVKYIVIEGTQGAKERLQLLTLIFVVISVVAIVTGFVGYFLSKLLMAPIKSRMEKIDAFIKDSSHDLNTPVSALMMSVSTLRNKPDIDSRILNHISISTKLISQTYNSLSFIAFHDYDAVYDEYFDLKELIHESVKFFDEIATTRGNTIHCQLEETVVYMDKSRIQKVINNLISNALKYSFPKSEIRIILKDQRFSIKDKGVGIKEIDQKAIFNRFERKNNTVGGFGIGLDIVKSVCNYYKIPITVHSTPNIGTTFELYFPKPSKP